VLYLRNNLNSMQRAFALGVAGLALAVSPAFAQPDPSLHRVVVTSEPSVDLRTPDAQDAADKASPATSSLAGTTSSSPEVLNAAQPVKPAAPVKADDSGLDWGSAGIGAGAVVAISLFGLAGVAVTHRARMHPAR
jgi:hypothetical protein